MDTMQLSLLMLHSTCQGTELSAVLLAGRDLEKIKSELPKGRATSPTVNIALFLLQHHYENNLLYSASGE